MKRPREESIWEIIEKGIPEQLQEHLKNVSKVKGIFDDKGLTPLDLAVKLEKVEMVKMLLDKGADPLELDPEIDSDANPRKAYFEGLRSQNAEIRALMLKKYPINDILNDSGQTILLHCVMIGHGKEVIKLLLDNHANPNITDDAGKNALIYALEFFQPEIATLLLENGADPRLHDRQLKNALHWLMKATMKDPHAESDTSEEGSESESDEIATNTTPVDLIAEIAKQIIAKMQHVNAQDINGDTALHLAVAEGDMACVVDVLLQSGANPKIANKQGKAPIHIAAAMHDVATCKKLLKEVDNGWALDGDVNSPMVLAMSSFLKAASDPDNEVTDEPLQKLTFLFLSHATSVQQISERSRTYHTTAQLALDGITPVSVKVALLYGIAVVAKEEEFNELIAASSKALVAPAQHNFLRHGKCADINRALHKIPNAPSLENAEAALVKFDNEFLSTYLATREGIVIHPIMLDYFKQSFHPNPSVAFLEQFISVHKRIAQIQNLLQNGAVVRMNSPRRHVVRMDMIVAIFMCTSDFQNHARSWLPDEVQELLIAHLLQIPEEIFTLLRMQNSQNSGVAKQ